MGKIAIYQKKDGLNLSILIVYEIVDDGLFVLVIAVGKRDKNRVYKKA